MQKKSKLILMRKRESQTGQALVLVLLALAVVLTIVLFIISRSVTDISVATSENQAVSAFSAAEAGVEQALVVGSAPSGTVQVGDASYQAAVTSVGSGSTSFVYPIEFNAGDSATLWLHSKDASPSFNGNTLRVCWGKSGTPANSAVTPAVEVSIYYETAANNPATAQVWRAAYDPNAGRRVNNSFASPDAGACNVGGQSFQFRKTISLAGLSNLQFAVVRFFYNTNTSQPVAFDSTNASLFPSQGILVDSSGTSGESNRRVQVFQGWPEVPNVFQYGIYSSTGLTK